MDETADQRGKRRRSRPRRRFQWGQWFVIAGAGATTLGLVSLWASTSWKLAILLAVSTVILVMVTAWIAQTTGQDN